MSDDPHISQALAGVKKPTPVLFHLFNIVVLITVCLTLFFLLTNGIPLVQLGLMRALKGKSAYINTMRISVTVTFAVLLLTYLKSNSTFFRLTAVQLTKALSAIPIRIALLALTLVYIVMMSTVSTLRHLSGEGGDVAIFVQAIWNGTQGNFLYSSIKNGICVLGDHMSPILAFVIPLYRIWPDPILTFILQAVALGCGVYFTGVIAREKLKSDTAAFIFAVMYFFYFNARATLHYEFHPEALVEPFIFMAFIFLEKGCLKRFLLCVGIIILGKENMFGVSGVFGLYIVLFKPQKLLGATLMFVSVALFLLEVKWLMPLLSGIPYQYVYYAHAQYDLLGAAEYAFKIYSPVLFLSFLHFPTLLLTFPILLQNALSQNELMRHFQLHYTLGLHPFIFISSIYGFGALRDKHSFALRHQTVILCIVLWFSLFRSGPSEYFYAWNYVKAKRPYDAEMLNQIKAIGSNSSVLTQANFLPRLTNRRDLYVLDGRTPPTREIIEKHQFDFVVFDEPHWQLTGTSAQETLKNLQAWGYSIHFQKNGFYILKRGV